MIRAKATNVTKHIPTSLYRDGIRKLEDNVPIGMEIDVAKIFQAFFYVELEARMLSACREKRLATVHQLKPEATDDNEI